MSVVDGTGAVLGRLVTLEPTSVTFRDANGLLWTVGGNGSYDNSLNARLYYTSADCTGSAYLWPPVEGFVQTTATAAYRTGGTPSSTVSNSWANASTGVCTAQTRTAVLTPATLIGALPAPAPLPIRLQ